MTVAFGDGLNLRNDATGYALAGPHWEQNVSGTVLKQYPYLYKKDFTLKLAKATWLFNNDLPAGASVYVKATTNKGFTFAPQLASVGTDKRTITLEPFTADALSLPPTTLFFDKLEITFQISITGVAGSFQSAGKSANPVYVCIGNPPSTVPLYQTTVHLACSDPGAIDADQAFSRTFELIRPLQVRCWDWNAIPMSFSSKLYYYRKIVGRDETNLVQNGYDSVGVLLHNPNNSFHSGQCSCWAMLLKDAVAINGATSTLIKATAILPYFGFFVKEWIFSPSSGPLFWKAEFSNTEFDMQPPPDPNAPLVYGQLTNEPGLPGQNSGSAAPSEKVFRNHVFVKYTTTGDPPGITRYYDPSYGKVYLDELDFQDRAIAAISYLVTDHPNELYADKPTQGVPSIEFSLYSPM